MPPSTFARAGAALSALLAACAQPPALTPAPPSAPPFRHDVGADAARPWTHGHFARGADYFRFAVIGDRTGLQRPGVFEAAVERLGWLQPEFVVGVGDLIEGYSENTAELEREWRDAHALIDRLPMPFFLTVGNHDVGNAAMLDDWLRRHGRTYYHFLYGNALFLVLNTEDPPQLLSRRELDELDRLKRLQATDPAAAQALLQRYESRRAPLPAAISARQAAWAAQVLARHAQVRWTFVFMHKPAWLQADGFTAIEKLLAGRDYTVFAGHGHSYRHSRRNGRDYIRLGPAGGAFPQPSPGNVDHVTLVTMTPRGPQIANIALSGIFPKEGPPAAAAP